MRIVALTVGAFALASVPLVVAAQDGQWPPDRPIKFIVPTSAGGGTDILAREVGERLHNSLGANFIVEDRPGSAGNIGTMLVQHAAPDGTTFLFTQGAHTSNVVFFKSSYDPVADFEPIAIIGTISFMVCVNANSSIKNFGDLTNLIRSRGDKVTFGSAGYATSSHLAMELFKSMTDLNITHVPYHGTTPATMALLAGQVDFAVVTDFSIEQPVATGQVRCLATTGSARSPVFPDLPTIAEAMPLPGYSVKSWYGILGPAKLPHSIVNTMNSEVNRIVRDPAFVAKDLKPAGIARTPSTPELFKQRLEAEVKQYLKLARDASIAPQ